MEKCIVWESRKFLYIYKDSDSPALSVGVLLRVTGNHNGPHNLCNTSGSNTTSAENQNGSNRQVGKFSL